MDGWGGKGREGEEMDGWRWKGREGEEMDGWGGKGRVNTGMYIKVEKERSRQRKKGEEGTSGEDKEKC